MNVDWIRITKCNVGTENFITYILSFIPSISTNTYKLLGAVASHTTITISEYSYFMAKTLIIFP